MSPRASFLRTVPRKSLVVFLTGVFLLFSIFGIAEDMAAMGQQPLTRYVLTVLVIGTCAVGYAAAGFALRGRAWKVMIPLFLVEAALINLLHQWFPSAPATSRLDPSALAALQTRLNLDTFSIMAITFLGYGCFLYASTVHRWLSRGHQCGRRRIRLAAPQSGAAEACHGAARGNLRGIAASSRAARGAIRRPIHPPDPQAIGLRTGHEVLAPVLEDRLVFRFPA